MTDRLRRTDFLILLAAWALLAAATLPWIGKLGLEYDEAHFSPTAVKIANGAEELMPLPWGVTIAHRPIPFMTMPYVGTLDALVYAVPFRLFGSGVWVSRGTNLLLGALILALVFVLVRREAGRWPAAAALALLLADVEWVLHVPTNFGPILLQQCFAAAALLLLQRWWRDGRKRDFFLATLLLALAFHEKLTFIWVLSPLCLGVILFQFKESWRNLRWWMLPAGLVLAVAVLSPILYFAFAVPEVVLGFGKQSTKLPTDWALLIRERWSIFHLMLSGTWTMEFTTGALPEVIKRGQALEILFFGGLLAALWRRSRMALLLYTTAIGVWLWNLIFPDAGRMHHVLLMVPFWQAAAVIAISAAGRRAQIAALALLLWAGFDAVRCYGTYATRVAETGGTNHWSNMTSDAAKWLSANPQLDAVTTSWGILKPIFTLTNGESAITEHYFDTMQNPLPPEAAKELNGLVERGRIVWLVSSVMPAYENQWQSVVALAAAKGRAPVLVKEFPSLDGRTAVRAYRFDNPSAKTLHWQSANPAECDLPAGWQSVRVRIAGTAVQPGEVLNLEWLDASGNILTADSRPMEWFPLLKQESVFEFGIDFWPKSFTRLNPIRGMPSRLRLKPELRQAKIVSVEIGLP